MRLVRTLSALSFAAALVPLAVPAQAGPTVSLDVDLGTSTKHAVGNVGTDPLYPSTLFAVNFGLRAGWRFDVGAFWFLPEAGVSYGIVRYDHLDTVPREGRVVGGGRIGWSWLIRPASPASLASPASPSLGPELRFEPAVYGHVGYGWFSTDGAMVPTPNGPSFDTGLSLDLRIHRRFIVGAQVGYNVVMVSVPVYYIDGSPIYGTTPEAPWVNYGVHTGFLFW